MSRDGLGTLVEAFGRSLRMPSLRSHTVVTGAVCYNREIFFGHSLDAGECDTSEKNVDHNTLVAELLQLIGVLLHDIEDSDDSPTEILDV